MSKEYQLTKHNLDEVFNSLQDELKQGSYLIVEVKNPSIGKWGMSRLWRAWMKTTADFMATNGCIMPMYQTSKGDIIGSRPFDSNDAHELFSSRYLSDSNGNRLSWGKTSKDKRVATKGERVNALRQHEQWAIEKGVKLIHPKDSEYEQLSNQ